MPTLPTIDELDAWQDAHPPADDDTQQRWLKCEKLRLKYARERCRTAERDGEREEFLLSCYDLRNARAVIAAIEHGTIRPDDTREAIVMRYIDERRGGKATTRRRGED